jgi:hypothetical protein
VSVFSDVSFACWASACKVKGKDRIEKSGRNSRYINSNNGYIQTGIIPISFEGSQHLKPTLAGDDRSTYITYVTLKGNV